MADILCKSMGEAIKACAGFEKTAALFYHQLAFRFAHLPEVAAFFTSMEKEEGEHERAVNSLYASLSPSELNEAPPKELCESVLTVSRLIEHILSVDVKNLDDAYELAHQLEFSEVNSVLKLLLTHIMPRNKKSSFKLDTVDDHQHGLLEFETRFGDRAWRKEQKPAPASH